MKEGILKEGIPKEGTPIKEGIRKEGIRNKYILKFRNYSIYTYHVSSHAQDDLRGERQWIVFTISINM